MILAGVCFFGAAVCIIGAALDSRHFYKRRKMAEYKDTASHAIMSAEFEETTRRR